MLARFIMGPAGSGKTFRCLTEIRALLGSASAGKPLLLLAPRQATFQLERQLLADGALGGYTRLHVLSFDRLAEFVLRTLHRPVPPFLSAEGRMMVLCALLSARRSELKVFRATARLPGFARQVAELVGELHRHRVSAASLEHWAGQAASAGRLGAKLHDLALILRAYSDWLAEHALSDDDALLDHATEALESQSARLPLGSLWLDGFAEMTPQELELLAAILPSCDQATLAFCTDGEPPAADPGFSTWAIVGRTYHRLIERLVPRAEMKLEIEYLARDAVRGRFAGSAALLHLERCWTQPQAFAPLTLPSEAGGGLDPSGIELFACADPEAEATLAAREVLRFVRETGKRFRDTAILVRSLEPYHDLLRRVLTRYEIPFFLDRRAAVAHHPLAELTRQALRTVALGWRHDDWFGALKTGLVAVEESSVDRLENETLARGWSGPKWRSRLAVPNNPSLEASLERLRSRLVGPFARMADGWAAAPGGPTGAELAKGIRGLWQALEVEPQLEQWALAAASPTAGAEPLEAGGLHATVWSQMNAWLDNVALAFANEALPLREWLPILESGLANLTVGLIPPALDQVLVGAVDRSRNPDLELAVVLGLNESVFPASPPTAQLLTEADREWLAERGLELGAERRRHIGRERYYGYIACTRARRRLVLAYSTRDMEGALLHPSPFINHLERLFPGLTPRAGAAPDWTQAEHACELVAPLLQPADHGLAAAQVSSLAALPKLAELLSLPNPERPAGAAESLAPELATRLYGPEILHSSVSSLEQFAACPFKFFVDSGLRAEERQRFEVDARQRGTFQHEVLARFHQQIDAEGKQWRDLTPTEARRTIARIAAVVAEGFGEGLFRVSDQGLLTAQGLTEALEDFIETVVAWMRSSYQFSPRAVELPFGRREVGLPAWELEVGEGRRLALHGIIDRVDIGVDPGNGEPACVVVDYKSTRRKVDALLLEHGIQIQLPAYLAALRRLPGLKAALGHARLVPVGGFYVSLRGQYDRGKSRSAVLGDLELNRRRAYQHRGRFSLEALPALDQRFRESEPSGQFMHGRKTQPDGRYVDPVTAKSFAAMLDRVEERLRAMGREIFAGNARVDPYIKGSTACDRCDFSAICRIDPWTHPFRRLKPIQEAAADD